MSIVLLIIFAILVIISGTVAQQSYYESTRIRYMKLSICSVICFSTIILFTVCGYIWHAPENEREMREDRKFANPVTVEMYTVINDGVTRRIVSSKVVIDSLTTDDITIVNSEIKKATVQMAKDRQEEIDRDNRYWRSLKTLDINKEKSINIGYTPKTGTDYD